MTAWLLDIVEKRGKKILRGGSHENLAAVSHRHQDSWEMAETEKISQAGWLALLPWRLAGQEELEGPVNEMLQCPRERVSLSFS